MCFNPCFSGSCIQMCYLRRAGGDFLSFNPCFSGSCIQMEPPKPEAKITFCFNPCFSGSCIQIRTARQHKCKFHNVSILVLVDLAFKSGLVGCGAWIVNRFNPCFSGSCIQIPVKVHIFVCPYYSFNPCFSGSCIQMRMRPDTLATTGVSILVLVDLAFKYLLRHDTG